MSNLFYVALAFALGIWVGAGWSAAYLRRCLAREAELHARTATLIEKVAKLIGHDISTARRQASDHD